MARGTFLFEREHHRRIGQVLAALDGDVLRAANCLFGGGTAMTLRFGEYRESVDIDFLVSDIASYRDLRQRLTGAGGINALARQGATLTQAREMRADQYGIRTIVEAEGAAIKFEIVLEARLKLLPPSHEDVLCDLATLTPLDMAATKLLANSDRWMDDSVFSRDLIDLAMMQPKLDLMRAARERAKTAYGESIDADLRRAIERLFDRHGRLERCIEVMRMRTPPALLRQRIQRLMPKA
jgi:hypothetical protein